MQNSSPLFQTVATSRVLSLLPRNLIVVRRPSHFFLFFSHEPNKRVPTSTAQMRKRREFALWQPRRVRQAGKLAYAIEEVESAANFLDEKREEN